MRVWTLVLSIAIPTLAYAAAPKISFDGSVIEISGLTPGADVVLFGVQQEPDADHLKTRTFDEVLHDDDRDGAIRFIVRGGLKRASLWVVAELTPDGTAVTASPTGDFSLTALPGSAMRSPQSIAVKGDLLEFLYFRPGAGAWRQTAVDSGTKDIDGQQDGAATISFERFSPVGDTPPSPGRYVPGDVLIAINPLDLTGYELSAGN